MNYNIKELAAIVSPIAKKYGVERVCLFGSRARGDNTEESDYDFCIMPDKNMSLIDLGSFFVDLKEALKSEIDVVCEDSIDSDFSNDIEKEKVLIYEV